MLVTAVRVPVNGDSKALLYGPQTFLWQRATPVIVRCLERRA
jgi:hypothetical protein